MSDKQPDLTPFVEAAKRGCEDFDLYEDRPRFISCGYIFPLYAATIAACEDKRRTCRHAACVCIEWWQKRLDPHRINRESAEAEEMIAKLRAFKREYGEAK